MDEVGEGRLYDILLLIAEDKHPDVIIKWYINMEWWRVRSGQLYLVF